MSVGHTGVTRNRSELGEALCAGGHEECGIRDILDRVGDKWTILVLVELLDGVRRFRELQRLIPGISQRMLTLTLRRLQRDGLVSRTAYATIPPQVEYALTDLGHTLTGPMRALADWATEHRPQIAESRRRWDAVGGDVASMP
jgi:DNA-binding HxlR family transcriptional regulator